jgi:hypothetical protein
MSRSRTWFVSLLIVFSVAACGGSTPTPSPAPTSGTPLTEVGLKLRLIDRFGHHWFCDPDEYPIARGDEHQLAIQRYGEIKANLEAFGAIAARLGLPVTDEPTAAQKLAVYRAWKELNSVSLQPVGNGRFRFDYLAVPASGSAEGTRTAGIIDDRGAFTIEQQAAAGEPVCPICLARGTRIDTPSGAIAVEDVTAGTVVWSRDANGRRVAQPVIAVGQTPVPGTHLVVRLQLDDGRVLHASPGHPLADGRLLAGLQPGDRVDGATVLAAVREQYDGGATFDILVAGATGAYYADGIPLRSTMAPIALSSIRE